MIAIRKQTISKAAPAYRRNHNFRAGGKLVAAWTSPYFDTRWDERNPRCYKDLVPEISDLSIEEDFRSGLANHCRVIKVVKPSEE